MKRCNFDMFTIANLSFMDIALRRGLAPRLFAISKKDIGNREELIDFTSLHDLIKLEACFSYN